MRSLAAALALSALACNSGERSPSAAPSGSAKAEARAAPAPSASASTPRPPKPPRGCRVLTLSGDVTRESGAPVLASQTLEGNDWLELAAGAKLGLRHVATSREWTLLGPGTFRPCLDGEEQIALASGQVKASVGGGARPGAEVFVFTPFGTVRYGDASLGITADDARLVVRLEAGDAWLEPLGKSGNARPSTKQIGRSEIVSLVPNRALLEQRCVEDAQAAAEAARGMIATPNDKADLSEKAVSHLKARRRARLSCGEALAYAGRLEGDERGRLLDRLADSERIWRSFPRARGPKLP